MTKRLVENQKLYKIYYSPAAADVETFIRSHIFFIIQTLIQLLLLLLLDIV